MSVWASRPNHPNRSRRDAEKTVAALTGGFGRTAGAIGIVIACESIIGKVLERSGGALAMAETVLRLIGRKRAVVAMAGTGAVVSIPVFCDSGYVLLSPLNRALARQTGISIASFTVALGMGAGLGPVLATLAIAAGSMMVSHVNDSYFWVVTQMSGLTVTQGYRLVTVASAIAGVSAITTVLVLSFILL